MKRLMLIVLVIGLFFSFGPIPSVFAEYPERPITLVVSFRAGGNVDTLSRLLAKSAGKTLGQPILPVNKAGRGGGVAATGLQRAKPDGYTIGIFVSPTFTFNPYIGKTQYTMDDFRFICSVTQGQEAFVSSVEKPWTDWKGMIKAAKEKGGVTCSTFAPFIRLFLKQIGKQEGIKITPVPTKGGAGMVPQVLGGHVDFGFSGGIHYSYAKAGKMNVLAGLGEKRLIHFPEVPTLKELGYNLVLLNLVTFAAPKGVSDDVVKKISDAMAKAVKEPDIADLIKNKITWPIDYRGPAEITDALKEHSRFNKALAESLK
jgi:tripartite-type tricarboxylate transporter receptor subunit TctC